MTRATLGRCGSGVTLIRRILGRAMPAQPPPTSDPASPGRGLRAGVTRSLARVSWVGPRVVIRLHRIGLGPASIGWTELVPMIELDPPDVLSVDVFDTCIVRSLMGDDPIERALGPLDGVAGADNGGRRRRADELEGRLCRPIPGVAEALERIRTRGVEVVFLSDTDRSSDALVDILRRHRLFVDGDRLVASCEAGATKSDGDLYRWTWPDDDRVVWHVGNNTWADVVMANASGIEAFSITTADPTRYEEIMAARPDTAGPAVAAAARAARLEVLARAAPLGPLSAGTRLEVLGADVAGQAFTAFLLWVGEQAGAEELGHLAFLSRDGELFLDMARALPADHWGDTTLGYVHCSRWSWLLSAAASRGVDAWFEAGTTDDRAFIHANRHRVSFRSLLGRIGLTTDDLGGHAALAALDPGRPLPLRSVRAWRELIDDRAVRVVVGRRAAERHGLLVDYLHGLDLPRRPIGLVDVGWRGRLAWAMSGVVEEVTGHRPVHLHLGGDKLLPDVEAVEDIRRFAFDGRSDPWPITNPVSCVETMTASGRARVVDYHRAPDGRVVPVFAREVSAVANADRRRLWRGAVAAAAHVPPRRQLDELVDLGAPLSREALDVLSLWWTDPVRSEVEAMRRLAFEGDDDGHAITPLVRPYSASDVATGRGVLPRQWQEGSAVISHRHMAGLVGFYRRLRTLFGSRR